MAVFIAIAGGLLILLGELTDVPASVSVAGFVLFLAGVAWAFVVGLRRSRRDGIGLARAVLLNTRDSLRFAFELFP